MTGNLEDPRKTFGKVVSQLAMDDERMVLISADSGKSSGFGDFMAACPERYFEFGIMEQTATGAASGLATTGRIPVFCAIAPFVTARNFEMFRNDVGYMKQNVKIVGRNGGITYSELGSTHHSLDDFALIRMIPGIVVLCPEDPNEIRAATRAMIEHDGPVYMRIGNTKQMNLFDEEPFIIGKARHIHEGRDVTILSTGSMTEPAMKASELLAGQGISAEVIGLPTVWPLDESAILASVKKTGAIVTVEEHYVTGGLGSDICDLLCTSGTAARVLKIGVPHDYATSGPYNAILAKYGLDGEHIAENVRTFLASH